MLSRVIVDFVFQSDHRHRKSQSIVTLLQLQSPRTNRMGLSHTLILFMLTNIFYHTSMACTGVIPPSQRIPIVCILIFLQKFEHQEPHQDLSIT